MRTPPTWAGDTTYQPRVELITGINASWPDPPHAGKAGAKTYTQLLQWFRVYNDIWNAAVPSASAYLTYAEVLSGSAAGNFTPKPSTGGTGFIGNSVWSNGAEIIVGEVGGWFGGAPVDTQAIPFETAYGQLATRPISHGRILNITGTVVAPDTASMRDMALLVGSVLSSPPHAGVLRVEDPDWGRWQIPVVRTDSVDISLDGGKQFTFQIALQGRMTGSQGRGVWLEGADHYTSIPSDGTPIPVVYTGFVTGKPRLIIDGPLPAGSQVVFGGTGLNPTYRVTFAKPLIAGERLDFNVAAREVRFGGGYDLAGRSAFEFINWPQSTWPSLNVDSTTSVYSVGAGGALIQLFWTDLA